MALVPTQDPETTERIIAPIYGERTEVRELVERFRAGLPNAKDVPLMGLQALATAAVAHDLDPWIGEIWIVYNKDKGETSLMSGIKGLRKGAKRQLPPKHHMDPRFETVPDSDLHLYANEKDNYNRPIERIELCYLRRSDATERYIEQLDRLVKMCGSYEEARKLIGPPPVYVGIGVVRIGEKSMMERGQLCRKRAEADAIKRGFDLPFADRADSGMVIGSAEADSDGDDGIIEGTATETQETETKAEPEQTPTGQKIASDVPGHEATEQEPEVKVEPPAEVEKPADESQPAQKAEEPKPEPEPKAEPEPAKAAQEKPQRTEPAKAAVRAAAAPVPQGKKIDLAPGSKSAMPKTKAEKDKDRDVTIEALRRSSPPTLVVACEWIHKNLGVDLQPGKLSFELQKKLGPDYELSNPLPPKVWHAAIEMALNVKPGGAS